MTLRWWIGTILSMTTAKQPMIELDPQLHEALRARAEETQRTVSDLVDEAVRLALAEDAEDLAALAERREEPDLSFDEVVRDLRRRGAL